jgi:DNA-binding NarL/FixJ family response regulator
VPPAPSHIRVLLVDDDPAFAELVRCILTFEGIDVVGHALDGAEGVEQALALDPDVIVMDLRMPRLDGFDATRRILERLPGARILVVSSSTEAEDVERALEAGATGYLPKDRAAAELADRLRLFRRVDRPRPDAAEGRCGKALRRAARLRRPAFALRPSPP